MPVVEVLVPLKNSQKKPSQTVKFACAKFIAT